MKQGAESLPLDKMLLTLIPSENLKPNRGEVMLLLCNKYIKTTFLERFRSKMQKNIQ